MEELYPIEYEIETDIKSCRAVYYWGGHWTENLISQLVSGIERHGACSLLTMENR